MLSTLLESNAAPQRRRASVAASIAVHTAVIVAAIVATASAKTDRPPRVAPPDTTLVRLDPREPAANPAETQRSAPRPTKEPRNRDAASQPAISLDFDASSTTKPVVDVDPGQLLARDTIFPPGPGNIAGPPGEPAARAPANEPMRAEHVERVAALREAPRPRYPESLRAAGVSGRVVVRLVIDTAGRVEPRSVIVRESSHDLFAAAVLAVLPSLRFRPAEARGRRVRMLVELPFEFRLDD